MPDVVVTVPKTFRYGSAAPGLASWVAEGCCAGDPLDPEDADELFVFTTYGMRPDIAPGERVYVVCQDRVRGYAPLVELRWPYHPDFRGPGRVELIRGPAAVAVTIPERVTGFRGWRYRFWDRAAEVPFPDWRNP
jgi:hypothetical protein